VSDNEQPLVSIGIPVYNGMPYLREAVESVLGQSYKNLELIISDNASTDSTEVFCRDAALRDNRIRYIRNDENRGASFNFNQVLSVARAEYFKWLAADDMIAHDFIERSLHHLRSDSSAVIAIPHVRFLDGQGQMLGVGHDFISFEPRRIAELRANFRQVMTAVLRDGRGAIPIVFALGIRKAFVRAGGIRAHYAADCVFAGALALQGTFVLASETWTDIRRHARSSSTWPAGGDIPKIQQQFYNPVVKSSLLTSFNYRRRYLEMLRVPLTSDAARMTRLAAFGFATKTIVFELGKRCWFRGLGLVSSGWSGTSAPEVPKW
jgi:glycosyltransferase involved in cell wall biosynthesis